MSIEGNLNQIKASIWRALAQSGVDVSTIPADQQEKLVNKIADFVLLTMDDVLQEENPYPKNITDDFQEEERILWQGRPFLSLVETYVITDERLKIVKGLLGRDYEIFELIRLQDIDFKQHVGERMINRGDLTIRGHDASDPLIILRNVADPGSVYEILRKAWLAARKRHGLQFREYM